MINELLEKFNLLTDIAIELYGDEWVSNDLFWDSPTEIQMNETICNLDNLGYVWPEPTEEQINKAIEIAHKLDNL
jgi:hypothetical protein